MITREIVSTCSNPHIARAAIDSIGGDFAGWITAEAERRNLSSGLLAAKLVSDFGHGARDRDWQGLGEAIRGADMPILCGLQYIVEQGATAKERAPCARGGTPSGV